MPRAHPVVLALVPIAKLEMRDVIHLLIVHGAVEPLARGQVGVGREAAPNSRGAEAAGVARAGKGSALARLLDGSYTPDVLYVADAEFTSRTADPEFVKALRRAKTLVVHGRRTNPLTEAADALFPQGYGELARHLVSEVKESVGKEQTEAIFRRVAERVAEDAPPPEEGQSFEDRLDQVVSFLQEPGFLSRWEKTEEGYVLVNVNCPYRRVTQQHGEVCVLDTELIRRLLGVEPRRPTTMASGGSSCRDVIVPPGL